MYVRNELKQSVYAAACDSFFASLIRSGVTPCLSVALLEDDELVYFYEDGAAEEGGAAVGSDTQFNIGSVSKLLTGALVFRLVEQGLVSLNDKVSRYLPEFRFDNVTVLHLMTHTAGFDPQDKTDWRMQSNWPTPEEKDIFWSHVFAIDPVRSPGESAVYFTEGYALLMALIERVGGTGIERFAREQLFDPLGMADTTYDMGQLTPGRYVLPCKPEENRWDRRLAMLAPTGESSVYSTAKDLLKFACMLLHDGVYGGRQVYSRCAVQAMLREATGRRFAKTPVFWQKTEVDGYGCFGDLNSPEALGHPGFSGCMLFIDPTYRKAGALLSNSQKLHADFPNYGKMINILLATESSDKGRQLA